MENFHHFSGEPISRLDNICTFPLWRRSKVRIRRKRPISLLASLLFFEAPRNSLHNSSSNAKPIPVDSNSPTSVFDKNEFSVNLLSSEAGIIRFTNIFIDFFNKIDSKMIEQCSWENMEFELATVRQKHRQIFQKVTWNIDQTFSYPFHHKVDAINNFRIAFIRGKVSHDHFLQDQRWQDPKSWKKICILLMYSNDKNWHSHNYRPTTYIAAESL